MEERPSKQRQRPDGIETRHESSERFRQLFEDAPLGYQSLDADGRILMVNRAWLELLGYAREEVMGRSFTDFLATGGAELFRQRFPSFKQRGETHNVEFEMVRKDGKTITVSFEGRISSNPDGSFRQTHCILTDITDRRRAEVEKTLLAVMVDASPVSITVHDFDGNFIYTNERTLQMHGYTREEFLSQNLRELDEPKSAALIAENMREIREKGEALFEVRHRRKDGTAFPLLVHVKLVQWEGRPVLLSMATDITDRKRAEEALTLMDARFRGLVSNAGSGVAITDLEGRFSFVNRALCDLTGYAEEELLGKNFSDFLHPDDVGKIIELFLMARSKPGIEAHIEFRIVRKDGSARHCCSAPTAQLVNGEMTGFEAIVFDITGRKNAEEALLASEERFRRVFEEGPLGMALTDMQYRFLGANAMFCSILGYSTHELSQRAFQDIMHPDHLSQDMDGLQKLAVGEIMFNRMEKRYIHRDGGELWGRTVVSLLHDIDGNATARLIMLEDITARKRLEAAIRESEERYRKLFETMVQGVVYQDADGKITLANPAAQKILGLSLDQMQGRTSMHPEWRSIRPNGSPFPGDEHPSMVAIRTGKVQKNVIMGVYNPQIKETTWINISATPQFKPGDEKPYRVYTTFDDITERKRSEDALVKSEAKYRELFENAQIGMYRSRIDGSAFLEVNQKMADIFGYSRKELLETPSRIRWADQNERDRVQAILKERGGTLLNYETRMLTKNGDIKDVVASFELHEKEGYLEGTTADMTEQKRAADALRESESRYRTLFENMQEGYSYCRMLFDERGYPIDWIYLDVNKALGRLTGLENIVGKRVSDVLPDIMKSNPELLQMYGRVASTGKPETREVDISGLGLKAGWLNISAFSPMKGDFVAVFSDISERKKTELVLRRALMRYELEEGRLYMVMESGPRISYEAFRDLLKVGYEGFVVTRSTGAGSELWQQVRCTVVSLSMNGGKGSLTPDATAIGDWAEGLARGRVVLFDRLDYLVTRLGFKRTLLLVHHLVEIASLNNHIMILSVDPATLDARGVRLLEKEGARVESLAKESVPEDLLETMKQIYEKNIAGVRPTMTSIGRDLGLSKPTVRKRMWKLLRLGYIVSHSRGSSKSLELTEKGRAVFLR